MRTTEPSGSGAYAPDGPKARGRRDASPVESDPGMSTPSEAVPPLGPKGMCVMCVCVCECATGDHNEGSQQARGTVRWTRPPTHRSPLKGQREEGMEKRAAGCSRDETANRGTNPGTPDSLTNNPYFTETTGGPHHLTCHTSRDASTCSNMSPRQRF